MFLIRRAISNKKISYGIAIAGLFLFTNCGYHFQNSKNPLEKIGIKKVYVAGFKNKSNRTGIEYYFTTAMIKEIQRGKVFELTNSKETADGLIFGEIVRYDDQPSAVGVVLEDTTSTNIANRFHLSATIWVRMEDSSGRIVFSDTFGSSKSHPASLVISGEGKISHDANATAPLINESEGRLALKYLADQLVLEAHQKLIDLF